MARWRRWCGGAAVAAAAVLVVAPAGQARPTEMTLPQPTLSSTDLHLGDVVTVSGTGCLDPETQSGDGLDAMVFRWRQGRTEEPTNEVHLPVAADGSYSGGWTIDQDLQNGTGRVAVMCTGGSLLPYDLYSEELIVTTTAPSIPDIVGAAGEVVGIPYACPEDGYGFDITLEAGAFGIASVIEFPEVGSVGRIMQGRIPEQLAPGTYPATAACRSEGGSYAHFSVQVVVTAPVSSDPPATAPAAEPQPGSAAYTG